MRVRTLIALFVGTTFAWGADAQAPVGPVGIATMSSAAANAPIDPVASYHAAGTIATTTGTIPAASHSLVVANASGWAIGQGIAVAGAGAASAELVSSITGITGTTFTLADAASTAVTNAAINHDDTAAISAAITASQAAGTPVHLPAGDYNVTGSYTINTPITFYGDGRAQSRFWKRSATGYLFTIGYSVDDHAGNINLAYAGANFSEFGVFQGSGITPTAGGAFLIASADTSGHKFVEGLTIRSISTKGLWTTIVTGDWINANWFEDIYVNAAASGFGIIINTALGTGGDSNWSKIFFNGGTIGGLSQQTSLKLIKADTQNFTNLKIDGGGGVVFANATADDIRRVRFVDLSVEDIDTGQCGINFGSSGVTQVSVTGGEFLKVFSGQEICGTTTGATINQAIIESQGIVSNQIDFITAIGGGITNPLITTYASTANMDAILLKTNHAAGNVLGIQNASSSGNSGIEFIDNSGATAVFAGYINGGTGEYKINNIATNGFIDFRIGSTAAVTINHDLSATFGGRITAHSLGSTTAAAGKNALCIDGVTGQVYQSNASTC